MLLYGEEGGVERGCSEGEPAGEKQFRVMRVSHQLSCRGGRFHVGDAVCTFPVGPAIDEEWYGFPFQTPSSTSVRFPLLIFSLYITP